MSAVDWGGGVPKRRRSEQADTASDPGSFRRASAAHPDLLRALIEHTTDVVTVVSADGTITYQSPSCRRVLGYDPEELIGTSSFNLVHPDDLPWVMPLFADLVATAGVAPPVRVRCRHKNGSWVELEAVGNSLFDQPEVAGMVISSRDIGGQARAERALQESQRWLETVVSGAPIVLFAFDRDGILTLSAGRGLAALGTTAGQGVGKSLFSLYANVPGVLDSLQRALHGETFRTTLSRTGMTWSVDLSSLRDRSGNIVGGVGVATDITVAERAQRTTAALLEIAKTIGATQDLDALLARVQPDVASLIGCEIVATYCRAANGTTELRACHSPGTAASVAQAFARLDRDLTWVPCLERGQEVILNELPQSRSPPDSDAAVGEVKSLAMLPLNVRGQTIGALVLARSRTDAPFTADDVELGRGIAGHLAVAIARAHLDRARQDEVLVTSAIARVGRELISCLDTPILVDRLCRVTTEVLGCDFCETRFWDASRDMFVHVSAFGVTTEEREGLRPINLPRTMLPLEAGEVWEGCGNDFENPQLAGLARQFDVSGVLIIPLRRGTDLIGMQAAGFRGRQARFAPPQLQIARAIGQLAVMAIENARLVEELQRASRLKSEFVATMSHELRTPLNVIIGYTDLLIEDSFGPINAEQRQVCRRVERSAEELLGLINATLDLGRLESGRLPLQLEDVSIPDLAAAVEAETRELCDKPNVSVQWHIAANMPLIHTDALKVRVILKNLIANAMKFTVAGEVEVTIGPEASGVALSVRDTGIGVPIDMQSIIFEPFRQVDSSMSRRFGGVGLGLYIVRRLTDVLGGAVTVTSEVGKGSTFRVYLPGAGPRERL